MQQLKITYRKRAFLTLILGAINALNGAIFFYFPWTIFKNEPAPSLFRSVYELIYDNLLMFFVINLLIFANALFFGISAFRSNDKRVMTKILIILGVIMAVIGLFGVILQYFFIGMMISTL